VEALADRPGEIAGAVAGLLASMRLAMDQASLALPGSESTPEKA